MAVAKTINRRRTLKPQNIIKRNSEQILDTQEAKGSEHDFKIYKETKGTGISNGIKEYHANSFIPAKPSKKHQLNKNDKAYNKELSLRCVVTEHINTKIKTFKGMAYPSCGHCCSRHSQRIALICDIINYDRLV
jgi:hypothetical protein